MTEHFKAPEKIQLSEEEIANLSDTQFKTLVINMLTDLVESVRKTDEKMKPMLRETKENVQAVSYTHLTLPTTLVKCRSRWSPYH